MRQHTHTAKPIHSNEPQAVTPSQPYHDEAASLSGVSAEEGTGGAILHHDGRDMAVFDYPSADLHDGIERTRSAPPAVSGTRIAISKEEKKAWWKIVHRLIRLKDWTGLLRWDELRAQQRLQMVRHTLPALLSLSLLDTISPPLIQAFFTFKEGYIAFRPTFKRKGAEYTVRVLQAGGVRHSSYASHFPHLPADPTYSFLLRPHPVSLPTWEVPGSPSARLQQCGSH